MRVTQMPISYALTDEKEPLRTCRGYIITFIANNTKQIYCSPVCKEKEKDKKAGDPFPPAKLYP